MRASWTSIFTEEAAAAVSTAFSKAFPAFRRASRAAFRGPAEIDEALALLVLVVVGRNLGADFGEKWFPRGNRLFPEEHDGAGRRDERVGEEMVLGEFERLGADLG